MNAVNKTIIRARDVMQKNIVSIDGMATAKEAADKMRAEGVAALLVTKRHPDDAWGIVSVQDLVHGVIVPGCSSSEINVYEIMTKPVLPVPAEMDIMYVSRLLHCADVWRVPVEDKGEIVGMISQASLVLDNELF